MRDELHTLLRRNGFILISPSQPTSTGGHATEFIAQCSLGCDLKRTGRFAIPFGATPDHSSIVAAIRHVEWCRNAQKRRIGKPTPKASRRTTVEQNKRIKQAIYRIVCEVLQDKHLTSGKEQASDFQKRCKAKGIVGVTANTFKRIKYLIGAAPF